MYAKLCVSSTAPSDDLLGVLRHVDLASLSEESHSILTFLLILLQKHSYILRDHPHLFFNVC